MKIPDDRKPSYEVTINGVKNSFVPGTEVGGDVASALFGTENFPPAPPETDKPFNIPASGSTVSANPTLAGTEDSLTGLEIDGTKYAVGGGGGGVLVLHVDENYTLDKTWQEIYDAPFAVVKFGIAGEGEIFHYIASIGVAGTEYTVNIRQLASDATDVVFTTNSPNGYPVYSET